MYFVDREKIDEILRYLERQIRLFEEKDKWEDPLEQAALERLTHTMIEAFLDVGNAMIDGFIMRDPGSYEDIIDILADEKVITAEMSSIYKNILTYRKMLIQTYTEIDHDALKSTFQTHIKVLKQFAPSVRAYLLNELGPVSAFKN
ncbi:DUF86 domain-containing protein [Bacillus canaveralius]|uniref:DUF86 domain-containing protein n=1 Tax=Bacillus canaveralius TaxID=1403243 RepID=A0A2N5GM12_9BACI|nr:MULTISPECIES: DUF86 domain-containing protein [Bacillus]PLR82854.1 DUF86 domain-containing protein [Bacillus canaveralius]PLR85224.1 DUF86 domain-containing protein [Bacillus sp. V33-4]PLR97141.1 DUF86 domain-containing protein [Bacillus canaveralius]RSK55460.1 DUF86 domain-containing protein [Bacillus canaveralius]